MMERPPSISAVLKFGGTSVKDFSSMKLCAEIISSTPSARFVVLSATAKTTDLLVQMWHERKNPSALKKIKEAIFAKHISFATFHSSEQRRLLQEWNYIGDDLSAMDELLSWGEETSSRLFSALLNEHLPHRLVQWVDAREFLITDDTYQQARPQTHLIEKHLQFLLKKYPPQCLFVTQGFVGRAEHTAKTTTLGRGGSDYSAALIASALNSTDLQIWTDVAGIYSIDPKLDPRAKVVETLDYDEAAQLAQLGAKVLHPLTLIPTIPKKIPVLIKSTFDPKLPGTLIKDSITSTSWDGAKAIAVRLKQAQITIKSLKPTQTVGHLSRIFQILERHHISVDHVTTSEISTSFSLSAHYQFSPQLMGELEALGHVTLEQNLALLSLVGKGLTQNKTIIAQLLPLLEEFNLRSLFWGPINEYISCLLSEDQVFLAATKLHQEIIL